MKPKNIKNFVAIIIMGACNLHCAYCSNIPFVIREDETLKSLKEIMDNISKSDTVLRVECRGEITLYKPIVDFLICKAREGYTIEILSNGLMIDRVIQPNDPVHIVISLDGHTAKMNRMRRLTQIQVDDIIQKIFIYSCEIQCVYAKQTMGEMKTFIEYLDQRNFLGFLHIFPCSQQGKVVSYLDFDKLPDVSFIPKRNFFERWKYIFEHGKRNFICDFYKDGYTYYINNEKKYGVKCDCVPESVDKIQKYHLGMNDPGGHDCLSCINHYEYNNSRKIMQYS